MKILKLKVISGFRMLEKDFEINFLTKTRVDKDALNEDLIELENGFYYPIETAFIGKNSSGKTTTLLLINTIYSFLRTGRIDNSYWNNGDVFEFNVVFYSEGIIYNYYGK